MASGIATFYPNGGAAGTAVSPRERALVAALLAAYLVALGWQAWHVGLTFDEPTHMLGGWLYWLGRADLYPQDMPPLIKILTGWIPRALDIPLHLELPSWQNAWKQDVASEILDRLEPERIRELFYLIRLVLTIFPILTALLVWHWARLLFGRNVAGLVLLAAVLKPTPLAHGCLLKNDMAATFAYLLAAFCGWRFWLDPRPKNVLRLAAAILLGMLAKLSLLVVWPLALVLVLARLRRRELVLALAAVVLIPYLGFLAAYRFEARRLTPRDLVEMREQEGFPKLLVHVARIFRFVPTPTDVQRGIRSLQSYQKYGAPTYLLGEPRSEGHPSYFPVTLAVKTPIAVQVLFLGGLILAARRWTAACSFLLIPALLYLGLAMQSNLQLGVRLVLPCFPFFLLISGFAIERGLATRRGRAALALVFVWLAWASASIYPRGIAYFNEWAGGPGNGWKYLADSNVDWGQGLPDLADYVLRHRLKNVRLYYFGFDKLHRYGVQDRIEMRPPPWNPKLVTSERLDPEPGYYAISVTLLPGHFFDSRYRDYFRYFRERKPSAQPGYSIFVYKVD